MFSFCLLRLIKLRVTQLKFVNAEFILRGDTRTGAGHDCGHCCGAAAGAGCVTEGVYFMLQMQLCQLAQILHNS